MRSPAWIVVGLLACVTCGEAASDAPVRIMPLGDSITQGARRSDSYRRGLWFQLQEAGYAVDFVGSTRSNHRGGPPHGDFDMDHEGHWGRTVDQVLERLDGWARAAQPDVVLLHLGSNDIFRGQPPDEVVAELRSVIETLRAIRPDVTVLVAEIIPAEGRERIAAALNERIRELVKEPFGAARVMAVDQNTGFDAARHTYDGVHPNTVGESLIAQRWFEALRPILDARRAP